MVMMRPVYTSTQITYRYSDELFLDLPFICIMFRIGSFLTFSNNSHSFSFLRDLPYFVTTLDFTFVVAYWGSQTIWGDRTSGLHDREHHSSAEWVWTSLHFQWIQTRFTLREVRCRNVHCDSESRGQRWGKGVEKIFSLHISGFQPLY